MGDRAVYRLEEAAGEEEARLAFRPSCRARFSYSMAALMTAGLAFIDLVIPLMNSSKSSFMKYPWIGFRVQISVCGVRNCLDGIDCMVHGVKGEGFVLTGSH